jgi:hypothetical protein
MIYDALSRVTPKNCLILFLNGKDGDCNDNTFKYFFFSKYMTRAVARVDDLVNHLSYFFFRESVNLLWDRFDDLVKGLT